jgi:hypothetical protein
MLLVARQRIAHESFSCWHELLLRAGWSFSSFPHNLDGFLLHFRFGLLAYPFSRRFLGVLHGVSGTCVSLFFKPPWV